jgi:hypothetical protein
MSGLFTDFDRAIRQLLQDLQQHRVAHIPTQIEWEGETVPVTISAAPFPGTTKHEVVCKLPAGTPEALVDALWDHVDTTVAEAQDVGTRDGEKGSQLLVFDLEVTRAA